MCECVYVYVCMCVCWTLKLCLRLLLPFLSHAQPKSDLTPQFLQLVQEFLNLYNTSHPSPKFQEKLQSHLFDSLQQMPNAHLLTLPIISAGVCVCVYYIKSPTHVNWAGVCMCVGHTRFTDGCTGAVCW